MKRIGVLTSGGDSPGMNPTIRAVVRGGIYNELEVFGIKRGYEGLIEGDIYKMNVASVGGIINQGGTMLKTARSDYYKTEEGFGKALESIKKNKLEGIVVIGGDGSLRGAVELSKAGIPAIGIPGTIDNDLPFSDFSIGFDTACNTILDSVSKIRDTSSSHDRVSVIEVMGRRSGELAIYAGITGGADAVLVPEVEVDIEKICNKLAASIRRDKKYSIILKAEGVEMSTQTLAEEIQNRLDIESRIVVLGHIQRGGSPSARDRMLGSRFGYEAVKLLMNDIGGKALGIVGSEIKALDLEEALSMKKEYDYSQNDFANILSI